MKTIPMEFFVVVVCAESWNSCKVLCLVIQAREGAGGVGAREGRRYLSNLCFERGRDVVVVLKWAGDFKYKKSPN